MTEKGPSDRAFRAARSFGKGGGQDTDADFPARDMCALGQEGHH